MRAQGRTAADAAECRGGSALLMSRGGLLDHRAISYAKRHWHLILLACLVLFHALNNWAWLSTNVAILNSDARRHLMTSLAYSDMLRPLNLNTLFNTVTMDEFRPPLFQLSAVPLLWALGRSTDVATMVNVVYMGVLLASTYAIGKKMLGPNAGLFAAFVLSTFPTIYAMSRYFYVDFALTAVVALNVALLLYSDDFRRKGCTLLYGLTLGLGMLIKWTFIVFALPAALLVFFRSGIRRRLLTTIKSVRLDRRWALASVLVAAGVTSVWYLPNLDTTRQMFLGLWLLPLCWCSLTVTFYALSRAASQESNLLAAAMVAFSTAGVWYMPRIDFVWEFLLAVERHSQAATALSSGYLHLMVDEQLSTLYMAILAIALVALVLVSRRRWAVRARSEALTADPAVVGSWAVFSFLVFSFRASNLHSRYTMPMLPPLALLIAAGLLALPWKKPRVATVISVAIIGLTQFSALSYDGLTGLREAAVLELPGDREVNLFAHGSENQLPNSGITDGRYWIMPDILQFMREDSVRDGRSDAEVGILMKTPYVQASTFEVVSMERNYSELTMRELARAWSNAPVYPQLFELDYLVLKDGSQEGINREETREIVDALLGGDSPFLSEVFEVARRYPLPDGETVYLYRKKYHLTEYTEDDYEALAQDVASMGKDGEAIIFERAEQIDVFARHYQGSAEPYPLPRQVPLDRDATILELENLAASRDVIFAVLWQEEQVDPGHLVEDWLNRHAYRAMTSWYGAARLAVYAAPLSPGGRTQSYSAAAHFGPDIILTDYTLDTTKATAGQILRITLDWLAEGVPQKDYKIFLHLLDADDRIVGQHDSAPVGGSMPTANWRAGESIADNHGVMVQKGTPPGEYRLVLGMYEPETGERLSVARAGEPTCDSLSLARVVVE
jgi:4-amino-4-deoxy-L-arabinose transferase-like glycosyltransferase